MEEEFALEAIKKGKVLDLCIERRIIWFESAVQTRRDGGTSA